MGETASTQTTDALMIEFELCIGLIFKPLRHHLKSVLSTEPETSSAVIWKSVLQVLEEVFQQREPPTDDEMRVALPKALKATMNQLANEHLQNAITVLIGSGVLLSDRKAPGDITDLTWSAIGRMGIPESAVNEWRQKAAG